jgi:hypothetical protein
MATEELERFAGPQRTARTSAMTPGAPAFHCLACGEPMAECLGECGSLRCHDCRAAHKPLRADLAALTRPAGRPAYPESDLPPPEPR